MHGSKCCHWLRPYKLRASTVSMKTHHDDLNFLCLNKLLRVLHARAYIGTSVERFSFWMGHSAMLFGLMIWLVQQQWSHGFCVGKKLSWYLHVMYLSTKSTLYKTARQNVIAKIMVETIFWGNVGIIIVCMLKKESTYIVKPKVMIRLLWIGTITVFQNMINILDLTYFLTIHKIL